MGDPKRPAAKDRLQVVYADDMLSQNCTPRALRARRIGRYRESIYFQQRIGTARLAVLDATDMGTPRSSSLTVSCANCYPCYQHPHQRISRVLRWRPDGQEPRAWRSSLR
jgi:hypothetical protein